MPKQEAHWTTGEVAAFARASEATVRYWRSQGTGPRGFRVGKRVLYPESEVRRWFAELEQADQTRRASA